ncbi:DUF3566 domain-containing protein [Georgenia sp. SYP-B2076]|uniref:DUF3566 domain-containing protein n=1 Tax=Georgenia sp. SYP-B2076 TaxID=2495881 RepID=UPI000F8C63C9|nr:DUF3566 domain-containing protein [Georgenia sp. SYP-B2076]
MSTTPPGTGDRPEVTPGGSPNGVPGDRGRPAGASGDFAGTLRRSLADRLGTTSGQATPPTEAVGAGRPAGAERPAPAGGPIASQGAAREPSPGTSTADRPAPAAAAPVGPRRVRLSVSRVDPWSVMKLAFLLSVGLGIIIVVATAVVWFVLDAMHVFADIEGLLTSIGSADFLQLMDYLEFDRVMSFATIVGVVDILLLTALGTIGAFLYNIVASLVGGLHVTLTDD